MGTAGDSESGLLDALNAGIWAVLAAFLLFLIVRMFSEKERSRSFRIGDVELSIRHGFFAAGVLLLIALLDKPIHQAVSRWWVEASIPTADAQRLSVVIPDFDGPSGAEAADTVKSMLQSALGPGVQVIRVPRLPSPRRYGDAEEANKTLGAGSLFCAARYQADVVIWGTYLPGTQQLSVNYTAKGGSCFPSNCGRLGSRHPTLYPLSEAHDPTSRLARELSGSVVAALELATAYDGEAASAGACLSDPVTARTFATKASALLRGNPRGLDAERLVVAASYAAIFYRRLFEHSRNSVHLDRAISLTTWASSRHPEFASRNASLLANLLTDRAQLSQDRDEILRLAQRIGTLIPVADSRDREQMRARFAGLLETALYMGATADLLAQVEGYHNERLRNTSLSAEERLHHIIRIAGARAEFFTESPGQQRHSRAIQYARQAYEMLSENPGLEQQISVGDRCTLARSDATLTKVHRTLEPLVRGFNRATRLVNEDRVDWTNSDCAGALHGLAQILSVISAYTAGDAALQTRRLAVRIEKLVNDRDRTQPADYNRFFLAVARAELARTSGEIEDRREALRLLAEARRDAVRNRNARAQQMIARLIAEIS